MISDPFQRAANSYLPIFQWEDVHLYLLMAWVNWQYNDLFAIISDWSKFDLALLLTNWKLLQSNLDWRILRWLTIAEPALSKLTYKCFAWFSKFNSESIQNHVSHRQRCMKIVYLTDGDAWKSCISQMAMHEIMYPWCIIYKSCKAFDSLVCKAVKCFA